MFAIEFLLALVIALTVGLAFWFLLGQRGPWENLLWFLLILFFGTWAVGALLRPVGPAVAEVYWLPYLIAALLFALLLAAATPARRGAMPPPPQTPDADQTVAEMTVSLGIFFWILLLFAVVVIFLRYSWPGVF